MKTDGNNERKIILGQLTLAFPIFGYHWLPYFEQLVQQTRLCASWYLDNVRVDGLGVVQIRYL